jgi:hypothetical protein
MHFQQESNRQLWANFNSYITAKGRLLGDHNLGTKITKPNFLAS